MKKLFALFAFLACLASAQQVTIVGQGQLAPSTGSCADIPQMGNVYMQQGVPSRNFVGPLICVQTGDPATLGQGAYQWAVLAIDPPGTTPAVRIRRQVAGSVALTSGTPSTAVVSGLPFLNSTTYWCQVSDQTSRTAQVTVLTNGYTSGASFTITGPNTSTDTISYFCMGT